MGKWAEKSYDDELLRKMKKLFNEVSEKSEKDNAEPSISYQSFVESFDENDHFIRRLFEFLVKDTTQRHRKKRLQHNHSETHRHQHSLSSILQVLPPPRHEVGGPLSSSHSPAIAEHFGSSSHARPHLERRLSRDNTRHLTALLQRQAAMARLNHNHPPRAHSTRSPGAPVPSVLSAHGPHPFPNFSVRRRSIPIDVEHGRERERAALARRMSLFAHRQPPIPTIAELESSSETPPLHPTTNTEFQFPGAIQEEN
ncbi:hypothetical protein K493DRAFT_102826 [Basidiobolus meristosporus CBS 931.73]|uniref:Uncharacterized protein n=1 Tax=Basidiobolus meristosporus CBS 931.73 TaxID=1314790 RepID=A0A1Y1WYQ1_9FUNG|nr:hypothetical protein K493DRAFT_102826 [Basidiobolus meristosporus CBS 931.73]|eukprot:ORX78699.1 hypothetical protein K493DRAFT_102826 [Basidiobolus meristosporus CBS 931.73]